MGKLLLASNNTGKLAEMHSILANRGLELLTPADLGIVLEVPETGKTYAENAIKKANSFAKSSGLVTLADDTGLEVDALDGMPGIHSARYVTLPGATDSDRRARLLSELQPHPRPWTARFRCIVAIAMPGRLVDTTEGVCEGEVIPDERGHHGFGYDSIFLVYSTGMTMAELQPEIKNRISHRAQAILRALPVLKHIYPQLQD